MVDNTRIEALLRMHFWNYLEETPLELDDYEIGSDGLVTTTVGVWMKIPINNGQLPVRFREVDGDFYVADMGLTTLAGCPLVVTGDFFCQRNKLTSLKGMPRTVQTVDAGHNQLSSFEYVPPNIQDLTLDGNKFTSVEHCPPTQHLFVTHNSFEHFQNTPAHIREISVTVTPNLPLLGLLTVGDINLYDSEDTPMTELTNIMNRYAGQGKAGAFDCRRDMRAAGYGSNAQW